MVSIRFLIFFTCLFCMINCGEVLSKSSDKNNKIKCFEEKKVKRFVTMLPCDEPVEFQSNFFG